ncbi:peptidyl-prolyl cis-trans isomerase FKBP20-2, chloroplastic isoform X2 [Malania oleifera]|uniref:peptidyl-prolyl cis-trans isomerase FKBP20-2, chloroplastic isoform X2 n=1 Tax=Malania oleifera TaxID=397392 RepID=UPI0025AE1606|nr:peptidyl-prolyl cis-trans isomerase FKBP20-2, chloroplastic isoform X2 [Malania oleifera]
MMFSTPSLIPNPSFPYRTFLDCPTLGSIIAQKKKILHYCLSCNLKDDGLRKQKSGHTLLIKDKLSRRLLIFLVSSGLIPTLSSSGKTKSASPYDEKRLLEQNRRMQKENSAPNDFPNFVREGFQVKVMTSENYIKRDSGLIYRDIEVTFHYTGYNESGRRIDSTYSKGSPAKVRMGTNALVPGFEEGIQDMRPGGKRRIIIPPELGPPVGPSTFFSSKQFEVFDVELLSVQSCQRRTIAFYSDFVCT